MKKLYYIQFLVIWSILLLLYSCVEPFELPESATSQNLLVVDGGLNIESGTGVVKLSRTQNLADVSEPMPERRAKVSAETEQGEKYYFSERQNGEYILSGLPMEYGKKYRLHIQTSDGKEYNSAFVSGNKTPAIDSVTWDVERGGVRIKVNTHDPKNNTRYYRWEYEETYEYTSYYYAQYKFVNGEITFREPHELTYRCWGAANSKSIYIGSTVQLSNDVVRDFPLVLHDGNSKLFGYKYSILVKQYAISKEEFEYWQMLKKNTENVGTLFDAQPSQVTGNITCKTNPEEPALGYFRVQSVTEKRLFISNEDIRARGFRYRNVPACFTDTVSSREMASYMAASPGAIIALEIDPEKRLYLITNSNCADCTSQGGTLLRPEYWY